MRADFKALLAVLAATAISCEHVQKPYWGPDWGDLPPPRNGEVQVCIANVSTPWLMWIPKDASLTILIDKLGPDFFKHPVPDRLYILRRAGSNGQWMRWLKYDFGSMTAAEKQALRLHHGDYIYFWSTKVRMRYAGSPAHDRVGAGLVGLPAEQGAPTGPCAALAL